MAEVVITTPGVFGLKDTNELKVVRWDLLVVDEAQRIKNYSGKLGSTLRDFNFNHKLLHTGTPIQNNMNELWTLLEFIDPSNFKNPETFLGIYGKMKSKSIVDSLHAIIRPYMLCRLKGDVEKVYPRRRKRLSK